MLELTAAGIGAGVHRLWAHKTYKAEFPLRVFLMLCNCLAFQVKNNINFKYQLFYLKKLLNKNIINRIQFGNGQEITENITSIRKQMQIPTMLNEDFSLHILVGN